jgi:hypothetical protein
MQRIVEDCAFVLLVIVALSGPVVVGFMMLVAMVDDPIGGPLMGASIAALVILAIVRRINRPPRLPKAPADGP